LAATFVAVVEDVDDPPRAVCTMQVLVQPVHPIRPVADTAMLPT
jgi:hypothetical protein